MRTLVAGVLKKGLEEFVMVHDHKLRGDDSAVSFPDEYSALTFLRGFLRDPYSLTRLRGHLLRRGLGANLSRLDDQGMVRALARHLISGRIRVVRKERRPPPGLSGGPEGAATQPEEKAAEERPPKRPVVFPESPGPRNWVRIRVVDDETDEPIPGVALRIKLPSGEVGRPRTNRRGTIYLDDLSPGTLDILEILDDAALEVVGME